MLTKITDILYAVACYVLVVIFLPIMELGDD